MKNENLYIVMPAYNEEANIEATVKQWYAVIEKIGNESKLLIVNDGSKDATFSKLEYLKTKYPLLVPINKNNSGHGATVLFAYREAIKNNAVFIFQTDSDGQTNPDEFSIFWENRYKYDFQIGDRTTREDGFSRIIVTRVLRLLVLLIFHVWVKDANTPYRLMKTDRLEPILKVIPTDFFLCNVAISTIAVKWKERCIWRPITFKPRQGGVNSINMNRIMKIGIKAIGDFKIINKNLSNSKMVKESL